MVEFDEQLKGRLLAFQKANGITGDGVAGGETWQALVAPAQPAQQPAKPKLVAGVCNHPDYPADVLTAEAVAQLAMDAGFRGKDLVTAVAVAMAESGLDRTCYSATHDVGLWQINKVNWKALGGKEELYKATGNAAGAVRLYNDGGKSFSPWVAFKNGSYKTHLEAAKKAVQAVTGNP